MENVQGEYTCPSCGERIIVPVDPSAGTAQTYVEDCPVCCSPNELSVVLDGDWARVDARAE